MMKNFVLQAAIGASLAVVPLSAQAALVCSADVEHLNFGEISALDGLSLKTSGEATVSCSGGIAHAIVQVDLTIGSEGGSHRLDGTPRYMTGAGAAQLSYTVTGPNGVDSVVLEVQLDENGHATTAIPLDAKITSPGSEVIAGSYGSDDLVALRFCETTLPGETECTESAMTSSFTVVASVTASCTVSVSNMDFGNISPEVVSAVDQIATISLSCTNDSDYTIGLSQGAHFVESGPTGRRMNNNGDLLAYGLYRDAARTENWGQDAGTVAVGVGTGEEQSRTVFGRILSNQEAFAGTYYDTVVVIVTY